MSEIIESQLLSLERSDFDSYPSGIIMMKRDGTILEYNKAEAKLARREGVKTVGLNFWTDVAPCTAVKDFKGRFDQFAAQTGVGVERFDFVFKFAWGFQDVGITMFRKAGEDAITLMVTIKNTNT
ncbi:MAG: hypothetical protein NVSMB31_11660 [Vulcanimicrobiaceae bacterium]